MYSMCTTYPCKAPCFNPLLAMNDEPYPYVLRDRYTVAACGECPMYQPEGRQADAMDFCKCFSPMRPIGEEYPHPQWCPLQERDMRIHLLS